MTNKKKYVFGIYLVAMIALIIIRILFTLDGFSLLSSIQQDMVFTSISQAVCLGIIPIVLYFIFRKKYIEKPNFLKDFSYNKLTSKQFWKVVLIGFLMLFVNRLFAVLNYLVISGLGYKYSNSVGTNYYSIGILFLNILFIGIFPAVFEELANRGLIKQAYKNNAKTYILMSAFLFSMMHQNIAQSIYTFVGGLVMAASVCYTDSVFSGMIIHFMINTFNVLCEYGSQQGGFWGFINNINTIMSSNVILVVVSAIIIIVALFAVIQILKSLKRESGIDFSNNNYEIVYNEQISEFEKVKKPKEKFSMANIYLISIIVIGVGANIFTLIWGILR